MNVGWVRWASLAAVGVLALSACASGRDADGANAAGAGTCSPGITDTEIKIGQSSLQSGAGAIFKSISDGIAAKFKEINDKGGVTMGDGKTRKVTFISLDDGYDPARSVVNVKKLIEQDHVAAFLANTGTSSILAYIDYTTQKGVPLIFPAGSPPEELVNRYRDGKAMLALYTNATVDFENQARVKAIAAKNPNAKIAVLYSNEETGKTQLEAFKKAMEGTNLKIVATESYEISAASVDSQVTSLRGSNADTFAMLGSGSFITMALKKVDELGWHPQKWITAANPAAALVSAAGPGAAENVNSIQWSKSGDMVGADKDPAIIEYRKWATANGYDPKDSLFQSGVDITDSFRQILEATKECTSEAIYKAARSIKAESSFALPGITYGSSDKDPSFVHQAVQVTFDPKNNGWVPNDTIFTADE
ncbi:ABC transporter substrate-binding protein [Thermopolyspora sp. NPDC052614]|uniref:ABC transporter substrate-binding protein n=1 Tax=Thermopolyspora sp. NPDC052614 TaxID=3155682 RepID=UPI003446E475